MRPETVVRICQGVITVAFLGFCVALALWSPPVREMLAAMWFTIERFWPLALLAGVAVVSALVMGVIRFEDDS